jgi:nitrite reductase/ring-hydroxylating ferredoxin subunit
MSSVRVGTLSELPPGTVAEAEIRGQVIALCNVAGTVYALDGICPHAGGRLGHGAVHGYWLCCPVHGWEFDCRTGEHGHGSAYRVRTFPVSVVGGEILVDIDA